MQISHLEDMVISIKNRLNTEFYITTLLRTLYNTTGATRREGITYTSGAPEFIPGFYWCSCFSIFRWIEVRGKCSFSWYWWNYLPLLLISSVKLWKWMSNKYFRTFDWMNLFESVPNTFLSSGHIVFLIGIVLQDSVCSFSNIICWDCELRWWFMRPYKASPCSIWLYQGSLR